MSCISEHDSEDNESSQDTEYHSKSGIMLETGDYTLSNTDQKDSILNVQFPMPLTFPKLYLTLSEVLDNASDHVQNQNITEDPDEALHYICNNPFQHQEDITINSMIPRILIQTSLLLDLHQYFLVYSSSTPYWLSPRKISEMEMPLHNNG